MTLSTQNKFTLSFSTISSLVGIFFIVSICLYFHTIYTPNVLQFTSLQSFLTEKNQLFSILSVAIFSLYVPIAGFTIYFTFEKTKSTELLFFTAMLIGFFAETLLLCIPIFSLHEGYSMFLRSVSSIAFFGQMQVILSVLAQGVLVTQEDSRDTDRFLGLISVVSLSFAVIIPVNLTNISSDFYPTYGFSSLVTIIRIAFILITFSSMFFSSISAKSKHYKIASIAFLIICIGYVVLLGTKTFLSLCIGTVLLIVGSVYFLKHLHTYYMWK